MRSAGQEKSVILSRTRSRARDASVLVCLFVTVCSPYYQGPSCGGSLRRRRLRVSRPRQGQGEPTRPERVKASSRSVEQPPCRSACVGSRRGPDRQRRLSRTLVVRCHGDLAGSDSFFSENEVREEASCESVFRAGPAALVSCAAAASVHGPLLG